MVTDQADTIRSIRQPPQNGRGIRAGAADQLMPPAKRSPSVQALGTTRAVLTRLHRPERMLALIDPRLTVLDDALTHGEGMPRNHEVPHQLR